MKEGKGREITGQAHRPLVVGGTRGGAQRTDEEYINAIYYNTQSCESIVRPSWMLGAETRANFEQNMLVQ